MLHLPMLAYIDPGSGTLIVQMIVAAVVGATAFFRQAIFGFFGIFKKKPKDDTEPKQDR